MVSIPTRCWNSVPPLGRLAWHCARQCTDTRGFILLSIFFPLDFVTPALSSHLQGFNSYMNIRLPLFWSAWSLAWGQDSATCAGLAHGRDYYSYCTASEQSNRKGRIVFPWIFENTWKTVAHAEGFGPLNSDRGGPTSSAKLIEAVIVSWKAGNGPAISPVVSIFFLGTRSSPTRGWGSAAAGPRFDRARLSDSLESGRPGPFKFKCQPKLLQALASPKRWRRAPWVE